MPVATASRKRKQTDDMEVSPPKRVTRARTAAKAQDSKPRISAATTASTATASTASTRARTIAKTTTKSIAKPTSTSAANKTTESAGTTSRTAKTAAAAGNLARAMDAASDTEADDEEDDVKNTKNVKSSQTPADQPKARGRGRPRKAVQEEDKKKGSDAPKPRGRPPKSSTAKTTTAQKMAVDKMTNTTIEHRSHGMDTDSDDDELAAPGATASTTTRASRQPTKKVTKVANGNKSTATTIKVTAPSARAAAVSKTSAASQAGSSATTTDVRASTGVSRHVTVSNDSQDKENRPVSRGKDVKSVTLISTSTGVRGKPVRKPTTGKTTQDTSTAGTRMRGNSASKQPSDEDRPKTPLSPKKVDQVAKGNAGAASPVAVDHTSSSEDELSGTAAVPRSPEARPLQKTPVRPPSARQELSFANASVSSPIKFPQSTTPVRPKSKDNSHVERMLDKTPVRPPTSPSKMSQFSIHGAKNGRPKSRDGEQIAVMQMSLLDSPAKRPPPAVHHHDQIEEPQKLPGLSSSPVKKAPILLPRSEQHDVVESSKKRNLLQSPARRPKVMGAMTSIPKEKKVIFPFGDEKAQGEKTKAFKFAAATPRRIRLLKPSQRLLEDVIEEGEGDGRLRGGETPDATSETDAEGDTSMLDVQDGTIIYTPSKKRTTLFDSPLPTRSRSVSPQKVLATTPFGVENPTGGKPVESSVPSTARTSRMLFRDPRVEDSEDDQTCTSLDSETLMSVGSVSRTGFRTESNRHSVARRRSNRTQARDSMHMTPLAHQFSAWLAASPEKKSSGDSSDGSPPSESALSSSMRKLELLGSGTSIETSQDVLPDNTSQINDETIVLDIGDTTRTALSLNLELDTMEDATVQNIGASGETDEVFDGLVHESPANHEQVASSSAATHEHDDENAMPTDPALHPVSSPAAGPEPTLMALEERADVDEGIEQLSATAVSRVLAVTPVKPVRHDSREILTVSKIPLKPADSALIASPTKAFRRKAKSMAPGMVLGDIDSDLAVPSFGNEQQTPVTPEKADMTLIDDNTMLSLTTPLRTPRVGADALILRGAVVYVDVHTTEGADASSLFVELLVQMGARCVKQWSWNPRNSSIGAETPGGSKVGITHVIFKDGSKRTLEKVREAQGLVSCVGVGWVLDCERRNEWLDEGHYAVDISIVPRGGHNRRKSMEPRALANVNGTLRPAPQSPGSSTVHRRTVSTPVAGNSPTKEALDFDDTLGYLQDADITQYPQTPTISGPTFSMPTPTINFGGMGADVFAIPETPVTSRADDWDLDTPKAGAVRDLDEQQTPEPTTPYFMTEGAKLLQATCPPKQQTGRLLFPLSGRIEDEPNEDLRRRLEAARRKSLQWAPRIGSPLRKS